VFELKCFIALLSRYSNSVAAGAQSTENNTLERWACIGAMGDGDSSRSEPRDQEGQARARVHVPRPWPCHLCFAIGG
jgi:hypothetical protein